MEKKQRIPKVDSDVIRRALGATNSYTKMKSLVDLMTETEPDFISWVQNSTRDEMQKISEAPIHPSIMESFQSSLMKSKITSFYIYHLSYLNYWKDQSMMEDSLYERANSVYENWLSGELPSKFYPTGPKKGSAAHKARQAFLRNEKIKKAHTKKADAVSKKIKTMETVGIDEATVDELSVIPYIVETGIIETP